MRLHSLMFPIPPRDFPGQCWVRIAHLISMAVLTGGVSMGAAPLSMAPAFWTMLLTGMLFAGVELFYTGVWLFQGLQVAVVGAVGRTPEEVGGVGGVHVAGGGASV